MEMRKFVIELHADGSMTWAEYSEPRDADELLRLIKDSVVDRRKEVVAKAVEYARRGDCKGVETMQTCEAEDRRIGIIIDRVCRGYKV